MSDVICAHCGRGMKEHVGSEMLCRPKGISEDEHEERDEWGERKAGNRTDRTDLTNRVIRAAREYYSANEILGIGDPDEDSTEEDRFRAGLARDELREALLALDGKTGEDL